MIRQLLNKAPKCVALLGALPIVGLTQLALATPAPTSASGTIAAGQTLTVSGSNFGSTGPNIVMMEDFERDTAGTKVKLAGAPVGNWTSYNSSNTFLASPNAHTGSVGYHAYDYAGQGANILNLALGTQYQEAFISVLGNDSFGKILPRRVGTERQRPAAQSRAILVRQLLEIRLAVAGTCDDCQPVQHDSDDLRRRWPVPTRRE